MVYSLLYTSQNWHHQHSSGESEPLCWYYHHLKRNERIIYPLNHTYTWMDVVGPCCGWITGHHGPVIGPDIPILGVSVTGCASDIGPMCVLSSLKTQRETHMASTTYIYMNGCSVTMLWVDFRSPWAGNRSRYTHFGGLRELLWV